MNKLKFGLLKITKIYHSYFNIINEYFIKYLFLYSINSLKENDKFFTYLLKIFELFNLKITIKNKYDIIN